jgi:hypothetical protein
MKTTLIALLTFIALNAFSQRNPCSFKEEVDKFNGVKKKSSYAARLSVAVYPHVDVFLVKFTADQDTSIVLYLSVSTSTINSKCFGEDCWLWFKSGEEVHKVELNDRIDCGSSLVTYATLTQEDIAFLKAKSIDALRIEYTEGYDDIDKLKPDLIKNTLNCL